MEFFNWLLTKLLLIDAPPDAKFHHVGFLRGVWPWYIPAALVAVLGAVAVWFYVKEQAPLTRLRRGSLIILRVLVLAAIVGLLWRPVFLLEFIGERPQGVALLIDNSQSMTLKDRRVAPADKLRVAIANNLVPANTNLSDASLTKLPENTPNNPARTELVVATLNNPQLKLIDGLKTHGPLRSYLFGQGVKRVGDDAPANKKDAKSGAQLIEQIIADYKANESHTALSDAVNEILQAKDGDLPGAIFVITDGQDNASKAPLDEVAIECARLKVPLHIYGVGSPEGGSLQFKDLALPETIFYDDTVSVPVRWRVRGFKQGTATITLTLDGKVVGQKDVAVKPGEDFREVFSFTPTKKANEREEQGHLVATIQLKGNEDAKDEIKRPVLMVDRRVKVLYVENSPRWEFKFLMPALLRDRRVEPSFLLVNGDPRMMGAGLPFLPSFPARDKLFAYDLIILGDVPASYLDTERITWIQDFVREGGGLVLLAGRQHAPASYIGTPLAEVLPIEFPTMKFTIDSDARPQPYLPALTSAGERSDMLSLADTHEENQKIWKGLPGFYWNYPITKLRPGATALIVHPTAKLGEQPMPLAASHYYGKGQVLFLGFEESWRWRANVQDKFFSRFWGQIIYQLGLPHLLGNAKRSQLALEHTEAIHGKPSYVYARLFDADFRPLKDTKVTGTLEYLDAPAGAEKSRQVALEEVPGQAGEYRVLLAHDMPGRFELKLNGNDPATLPYRVNLPPRHELESIGMNEDALREAAKISGGKFYREEELYRLTEDVPTRKIPYMHRQEVLVWTPLAMILFVTLITAEWLVRKYSNLS